MNAVDSHAHVFCDNSYPFSPDTLYTPHPSQMGTAKKFREVLDFHGYTHALLVGAGPYGSDNRCMLSAIAESNGRFKFIWNQGTIAAGSMAVIKGNPGGKDAAMQFIASAQDPTKQVVMFNLLGQGPANPAADALLSAADAKYNPVDPANAAQQVPLNTDWYETNYGASLDEYLKIVSA